MKPVWAHRTGTEASHAFQAYAQSIEEDLPYLEHDLCGSIAHVLGLHHVGLLASEDATALLTGLQGIHQAHTNGLLDLDPALEDIHMNIEAQLTAALGDVGKRLHTGRSRNDQVATCITLHARAGLASLAAAAHQVANALTAQAAHHHDTPWVARTHDQPAQPATLGFLLAGHAFRFHAVTTKALQAFQVANTSPLGSGAVAGSTLPLDPAYTARHLGLEPPQNALLHTGARDPTLATVQACGDVGLLMASLAQDLLDLFSAGHLRLPEGFTTGSSLMPQKRNPDALELVRGHAKALAAAPLQATQLVLGLGLGYMRDLQAIKPLQTAALHEATSTLQILAASIEGATFHIPETVLQTPGIAATDAAEALVAHGVPFRSAYEAVATAYQAVEQGVPAAAALQAHELPTAALNAAVAALEADPAKRSTLGGPAPVQVQAQVATLQALLAKQQQAIAIAQEAVDVPRRLLTTPVGGLLG